MGLEAPRAAGGVERCVIGGIREVEWDRTWVVEESYNISSEGVGGLLDLTKPPRTVEGVEPNRGSDR